MNQILLEKTVAERHAELREKARQQGVKPIQRIEDLYGDFADDVDIDEFLEMVREIRNEGTKTEYRMNDFVVADTNIISYIFKKDTRGDLYKPHLEDKVAVIAAQTLAELELLPLQNNWSVKRHDELRENLKNYTFIEANQEICLQWAKVRFEAKTNGTPVSVGDAWIAATALAYSIPLVTHNYNDFKNISGLQIITEK